MSMINVVISREKIRNNNMINEYLKELETLPKGKIIPKTINGKVYYYLYYREGKKIKSKYIGKNENSLTEIREKLSRRNQIETILKKLKVEKEKIEKLEGLL